MELFTRCSNSRQGRWNSRQGKAMFTKWSVSIKLHGPFVDTLKETLLLPLCDHYMLCIRHPDCLKAGSLYCKSIKGVDLVSSLSNPADICCFTLARCFYVCVRECGGLHSLCV